ncbi:hypothetical protein [Mahella australiensis]|uniref:Uncharacterized protein n=1 Tax=Mahella australiensis (strain DSM 15567 / CIP 107919 / 50-1 BON) TaxID=697281 RepID=F3ZX57_MAHA5|nr:hypothetical protein [Mahella australiensis]AEE95506.1 hypothetical protein Mahau_0289 [Mahella australiensis 50-1 BON]
MLLIAIALFFTILSIIEYRRLQAARLIIDNQILYICQAKIIAKNRKEKSIDVYISCFGILLDFRLIRFNQNNVYLKSVEISNDFIYLAYGRDDRSQTIQLLHSPIGEGELADVMERFQYETGIIPKMIR